jgi:stage V sporulation protein AD
MPGKIIDGYTTEQSNMGAAMALSAKDTILNFFREADPYSFDLILTGDLGAVGTGILKELLSDSGRGGDYLFKIHKDAGLILFDREKQDVHSGASGCGYSASVMSSYILPKVERGEIKKMLLLSTGALMSTSSVNQGEHILGIAPLLCIESHGFF